MADNSTAAPTVTPNACSMLEPGDLPIFLMNSDAPDTLVFFALTDLSEDVGTIFVTDNAWDGTELVNTEGTMQFKIPSTGISAGSTFGFGGTGNIPFGDNWTAIDGEEATSIFDLSVLGDQVFTYCLSADGEPHFLWGLSYNGDFLPSNMTNYGFNTSALPESLAETGHVALSHADNCIYRGPDQANKTELRLEFMKAENYECQNDPPFVVEGLGPPSENAALAPWSWLAALIVLVATARLQ